MSVTPEEIRAQVNSRNEGGRDFLRPVRGLTLHSESLPHASLFSTLGWGPSQETLPLTSWAQSQLLNKLGIPASFFKRCPHSLRQDNANYFLHNAPSRRTFLLRTRMGSGNCEGKIRGVLSSRFTPCDDVFLIDAVLHALRNYAVQYEEFTQAEEITILKTKFLDLCSASTLNGQNIVPVYAGLSVRNSEVGYSALYIEPCIMLGNITIINPSSPEVAQIARNTHTRKGLGDLIGASLLGEHITKIINLGQTGILQAIEAYTQPVTNPHATLQKIVEDSGFLSQRFVGIVMEDIQHEIEVSKLRLAQAILTCCKNLPIVSEYEAQAEVGKWLGLFSQYSRFEAVAQGV